MNSFAKYFETKAINAACAFNRLMRAPKACMFEERPLSFFDDLPLVRQQRKAAAAARKEEEAKPPMFEMESRQEAAKRKERALMRRMSKAARALKVEWLRPEATLGMKPVQQEEGRQVVGDEVVDHLRVRTLLQRVQHAEKMGYRTMRIAGLVVPSLSGHFFQYLPVLGEMRAQWRSRMMRLRKASNYSKKLEKEQEIEDLPLYEQIRRRGQALGQLKNPYSKLEEVLLGPVGFVTHSHWKKGKKSGFTTESANTYWTKYFSVRKEKKLKVFGPIRKFRVDYQDQCVKRKLRLALYQDEWREARFLRRDKMSRALIRQGNHQVRSLRASLEQVALSYIQDHFKQEEEKSCDKNWLEDFEEEECQFIKFCNKYDIPKVKFSKEEYQGYGPHDFHWAPYQQFSKNGDDEVPEGQMDSGSDAQGQTESETVKTSNVELQLQAGSSLASSLPGDDSGNAYSALSVAESIVSDSCLHDRWFTVGTYEWKADQTTGTIIANLDIPRAFLELPAFKKSPNFAMFSRHMYWNGEIELKIWASTNARQYGQLQFSFYYGAKQDIHFPDLRRNIYTASQRLHSLLSANTCNEIIMRIPFEYIFPTMAINRVNIDGYKHLGQLLGMVVVPLTVAETTPNSCTLHIQAKFLNNKFGGMVGTQFSQAEMFPLSAAIAVKSLLDRNRDLPTGLSAGVPVIPINASSWCHGNAPNCPPFYQTLRLNPNAALPYETGRIPNLDEMTIDYVVQQFGMFKIIEWDASATVGQQLFIMNASPLDELTFYPTITHEKVTTYILPPVSVLSSMFAYWRGPLELRIDIVGATEVSGALQISYCPRYNKNEFNFTMDDCESLSHTIYQIQENRQICFEIPYVASHMFWPRRSTLSLDYPHYDPPGCITLHVYNRLIMNSTVPQKVQLVMYLRAGRGFEVAVPASPSVGLSFVPKIYIPTTVTKRFVIREGYENSYTGSWRYAIVPGYYDVNKFIELCTLLGKNYTIPNNKSFYPPIFRYGGTTDHITQYRATGFTIDRLQRYVAEPSPAFTEDKCKYRWTVDGKRENKFFNCKYLFYYSDAAYTYAMPLSTAMKDPAVKLFKLLDTNRTKYASYSGALVWLALFSVSFSQDFTNVTEFTATDSAWYTPRVYIGSLIYPENPKAQAGDEKSSIQAPLSTPQQTVTMASASMKVFGEQFQDLKDLVRRPQLYASDSLVIDKVYQTLDISKWRTIAIRFPIMMQGLDLDLGDPESPNEYWNRTREGHIPLIASAYRMGLGSIRFRICLDIHKNVVTKDTPIPPEIDLTLKGKVFVQHRPNIISSSKRVVVQSGSQLGTEDLELPTYAAYHQFDDLNNVISVEIPFYQPSLRIFLQRPNKNELAERFSDLGELVIGCTVFSYEEIKFNYDIYYSLGDDARFSVFVGFPPVIDISNIPALNPPDKKKKEQTLEKRVAEVAVCTIYDDLTMKEMVAAYNKHLSNFRTVLRITVKPYDPLWDHDEMKKILCALNDRWNDLKHRDSVMDWPTSSEEETETPQAEMFGLFSNKDKINDTIDKVNDIASAITPKDIAEIKETSSSLKNMTDGFKNLMSEYTPSFQGIQDKISKWMSLIINAITNFCHCLINFNLKSLGVSVISFLVQLKVVCYDFTESIVKRLTGLFSHFATFASSQPHIGAEVVQGEMAGSNQEQLKEQDSLICSYISTLIAGVAALFSFVPKFCKSKSKQLGDLLLDGIGKFTFTANHLFTFVKNNLIVVKNIGEWLFSNHPSIRKLGFLTEHKDIYSWAEKVIEYTDPRKLNKIKTSIKAASDVYMLAGQAGLIQIKMLDLDLKSSQVTIMNNLIKKIQDLRDQLARMHTAPPVRFEPFMYEFTGKTGIGKSELLKLMPYVLFNALGLKHEGELIYHRALGNQYWNNLCNQPVCTIDEKLPIEGAGFSDVQLAELFQLKSSCVFNPPMADIPDKNIRYNPIIVQYASNVPFPQFACLKDPEAVYRRRDALIRVEIKDDLKHRFGAKATYAQLKNANGIPAGDHDTFPHLQFLFHRNPTNASDSPADWEGPYTFEEFKSKLVKRFKEFFQEEEKKYRKEIQRMQSIQPDDDKPTILNEIFNYEWITKHEETNGKAKPEDIALKIKINEIRTYHNRYDLYKLKLKLAFQEWSGVSVAEMKPLVDEIYKLEFPPKVTPITENQINVNTIVTNVTPREIPQAQSPYQENQCMHNYVLMNVNDYFTNKIHYLRETDEWEVEVTADVKDQILLALGNFSPSCLTLVDFEIEHKENSVMTVDTMQSKIRIKSTPCKAKVCHFGSKGFRFDFYEAFVKKRPDIQNLIFKGKPCADFMPSDYLKGIYDCSNEIKEHEEIVSKLPEVKSYWATFKESFYNVKWAKWLKKLAIALSIFGFLGALVGLWNYTQSGSTDDLRKSAVMASVGATSLSGSTECSKENLVAALQEIVAQGHVSGDYKVSKATKGRASVASKTVSSFVQGQAGGLMYEDVIDRALQRNTFYLDFADSLVPRNPGRCLGICGRFAIIVDHFYDSWKNCANKFKITDMNYIPVINSTVSAIGIDFNEIKYHKISNSALALIELPKRIPNFKDIRKFIASRNQHRSINKLATVAEMGLSREFITLNKTKVTLERYDNDRIIDVPSSDLWDAFQIFDYYEYEGFSGRGRCGSVILAHDTQTPVVGIHVAGFPISGRGLGDIVYREMFDHLGDQPDPIAPVGEGLVSKYFIDAEVVGLGKVPAALGHQERGKSRIVPSKVQYKDKGQNFNVYTEQAIMSKQDPRIKANPFSPILEGCKHHGKPLIPFDAETILMAKEDLQNLILAKCKPQRPKVGLLTVDEAVGGFEGKPGYEHIEFSTSEGFPFVGFRPKGASNKRWLFNFNEDNKYVSCKPELESVLKVKWQQRLNNEIPATVFTDCLKDCTIAKEKVCEPGKTRIFSMSSVDFTIQQRQCTLDFVVAYMTNRLDLEHMVGCNPDSIEWTWLARRLLNVGNSIMTGDYSKYGDNLPFEFIEAAFQIIIEWYKFNGCINSEMFQQLKIMPYEVGHSIHLVFDHLYQMVCGQPSGNSLTVIINSIANSLYMRVAYLNIMKNTAYNSLGDFHKQVRMFSYGDDLIVALSDSVKDLFNAETICTFFAYHKLKFTNADKGSTIKKYGTLNEADFLKRGFLLHPVRNAPRVMLAPLPESSIEDTVNWVWSESFNRSDPDSPTFEEMSLQVCEDSIRNAFGRGPEYYNQWVKKLKNFWLKNNVNLVVDSWEQMDWKIFNLDLDLSPYHKWKVNNVLKIREAF